MAILSDYINNHYPSSQFNSFSISNKKFEKMRFAFILCFTLVAFLHTSLAAPRHDVDLQDMEKNFVEFLKQDTELSALLEKSGPALSRVARQIEVDEGVLGEGDQDVDPSKGEGFFDRAAKFVMEVLQRFLKWVNADN